MIHFNIILPYTPGSSNLHLSLRFTTKTLNSPLYSPIHATCYTHLILLDHLNNEVCLARTERYFNENPQHF